MIFIILIILTIVVGKFFYDKNRLIETINSNGGIALKYKILISYMTNDSSEAEVHKHKDYVIIINKGIGSYTRFSIMPAFNKVVINWECNFQTISSFKHKWEFDELRLSQQEMITQIDRDIKTKSDLAFGSITQNDMIDHEPVLETVKDFDITASQNKVIIKGYRRIAAERNISPSNEMSDEEIIMIYRVVIDKFKIAAEGKNTLIPTANLNRIALIFMQIYEQFGDEHCLNHLNYEIEKYLEEGLRADYKVGELL